MDFLRKFLPPAKPTLDGRQARMLSALIFGGVFLGLTLDAVVYTQREYLTGWHLLPRLPVYLVGLICIALNHFGHYRLAAMSAILGMTMHAVVLYYTSTTLEAGLASLSAVFMAGILITPLESIGVLAFQIAMWTFLGSHPTLAWFSYTPANQSPVENALHIMGFGLFALIIQLSLIHFLRQTMVQLEQARKQADAGSEAKSRFLSHISHELRTPASGVIGMLQLVLKHDLAPHTRRELELALGQAEFQLNIINDLLDLAKMEAGRFRIESQPIEVCGTLESTLQPFRSQAAEKGLDFICRFNLPRPTWVISDPQRLRQILMNLVGNAIQFTHQGSVQIHVTRSASDGDPTGMLQVQIKDTGVGIHPDFFPKLFTPFEQDKTGNFGRDTGTGLGLAISQQLAKALGGGISVESQVGQGSVFTLQLPSKSVDPPPQIQNHEVSTTGSIEHRLRILLVDDVATNRYIAQNLLERLGQSVECAEDGRQACEKCSQQRFDLVFMDMRMPVMNGTEAATCIREGGIPDKPVLDSQVRIIALTANASGDDKRLCLAHGMDGFLIKPLREEELKSELAKAIAAQQARGFTLPYLENPAEKDWQPVQSHASKTEKAPEPEPPSGTPATLTKIQKMWPSEASRRLNALRDALELGDLESLGREAHNVKGAARYLQLPDLAHSAEALEQAADRKLERPVLVGLTADLEVAIHHSLESMKVEV